MAKNKSHSQKFSSKRSTAKKAGGRAEKKKIKPQLAGSSSCRPMTKTQKFQAATIVRKQKIKRALRDRAVGGVGGPPRIVGIVPVNESANTLSLHRQLAAECEGIDPASLSNAPFQPHTVVFRPVRSRFTLVCAPESTTNVTESALDIAKVSDIMLLVLDVSQAVQDVVREIANPEGNEKVGEGALQVPEYEPTWFGDIGLCITDMTRDLVRCFNAQGCPTPLVVLQGLQTYSTQSKRRAALRVHQRYFADVLCQEAKVISLDDETECGTLLRMMHQVKLRKLPWREIRPYMLVEAARYDEASQTMCLSGYLRGSHFSAGQLMHITNHGTFQTARLSVSGDPNSLRAHSPHHAGSTPHVPAPEVVIDEAPEDRRETLVGVLENETIDEEQAWDPEEEGEASHLRSGGGNAAVASREQFSGVRPRGTKTDPTSNGGEEDGGDEDDGLVNQSDARSDCHTAETDADFQRVAGYLAHEAMTDAQRLAEREQLREASAEEAENPDEVDTPFPFPARQRFAKYRGLKDFHAAKWNPEENLPCEYARIFELKQYPRVRQSALERCAAGVACVGQFVSVIVVGVSQSTWDALKTRIVIASGLLQHEQKWSVGHFQVQRNSDYPESIKSKTNMLAHIGFRKFFVSPIFSEIGVGDRVKYSRYFHPNERSHNATFFAPISYHPCPILMFDVQSSDASASTLLCFGASGPPNPRLLILKRAVLSGRVAVIHKKMCVIKHMFYNCDDVLWFRPVDLFTKLGRKGRITKPLGLHGLYKAQFSDQMWQHDVVFMELFKRVFPKWTTVPFSIDSTMNDEVQCYAE